MNTKAEEATALKAVTRRRLVKTQQNEKPVVNCRMCELAIALWLLVVTIWKCSINSITNPNPVYIHCNT
jgi:hypothetical protein